MNITQLDENPATLWSVTLILNVVTRVTRDPMHSVSNAFISLKAFRKFSSNSKTC